MPRLNFIVEGQTEEAFVNDVLKAPLAVLQVWVAVRRAETSRDKKRAKVYRGGLFDYERAKRDVLRWMKEDQQPDAHFTTMFDLYDLPDDFPGFTGARKLTDPRQRVATLEAALREDINHPRFIPYIQLHEFEALVLADPRQLDWEFVEHAAAIERLASMCAEFVSPELIDDGPHSAPSKRIIKEIPEYEGRKATAGPFVAAKIGLAVLRQKCPHFDEWLKTLESLK